VYSSLRVVLLIGDIREVLTLGESPAWARAVTKSPPPRYGVEIFYLKSGKKKFLKK